MSEFSLVSDAAVASHEPMSMGQTALTHATGELEDVGSAIVSVSSSSAIYHQSIPKTGLDGFLNRYVKIQTSTISNSNTVGQLVLSFDPWALFLANPAVADKIKNFSLIRGTIEVVAMMAIPGNCYGSYILTSSADGGTGVTVPAENSFTVGDIQPFATCMQVDHYARVNCADAENLVLQLPFLWPFDFSNLPAGPTGSWIVNLFCMSPLRTAIPGGVQVGSITYYARIMEDLELSVPRLQGHERKGKIDMHPTLARVAPRLAAKVGPGSISSAMSSISKVADAASSIPIIGSYAAAASKIASTAGDIASWFGFTKEAAASTPTPFTIRPFSSIANVDGSDASDIAALSIGNSISIDPSIGGGVVGNADCLSTADLFSRWTLINTFTWQPSDAANTILASIPVTPAYLATAINSNPIVAGWYGLPFAYWRGDMEYLVILPVSSLHKGTVQAYWVPYGTTSVASDVTNISLNYVQGVDNSDEAVYKVGFARDQPYLHNEKIAPSGVINTSWTNGTFLLQVVNPLTSQNTSAVVTGHIFARACSNMDFAVPRVNAWDYDGTTAGYRGIDNWTYQGKQAPQETELVAASMDYPSDEILFGEKISSVRALLQKPCLVTMSNTAISQFIGNYYIPQLGPLPKQLPTPTSNPFPVYNTFSYQGWYRAAFTGIATSERVKVFTAGVSNFVGVMPYVINSTMGYEGAPGFSPVGCVGSSSTGNGYEALVPYYTPLKYKLGRQCFGQSAGTTSGSENRGTKVWINSTTASAYNATTPGLTNVYHSYGPDIRVTNFRFIPTVNTWSFDRSRPITVAFTGAAMPML